MRKQELIKRIEVLPYTEGPNFQRGYCGRKNKILDQ